MAKAIHQYEKREPDKLEEQTEALQALLQLTSENRAALTSTLEIVQELHSSGLLDIIKGALRARHKIGALAIHELNQPGMHHLIRNGMNMVQFLSALDPDKTKNILNGFLQGTEEATRLAEKRERVSIRHFWKTLRDPEINTSLSFMLHFLKGMGNKLNNKK